MSSIQELKKIAYKSPETEIEDVIDKWYVKCMNLIYIAQANNILELNAAKEFTAKLEQDYNILKLRQRLTIKEVAHKIAALLLEEKEVNFEEYPFSQTEWRKISEIINNDFVQSEIPVDVSQ